MALNVSFSGCGFLGIYHVGVASAIREYAPDLCVENVSGASAGAIAACGLICGMCLGQATSDVLKVVIQARQRALGPLHPSFNIMKLLRQGLRRNLPNDCHITASGRLHISLTRFSDGQNVIVNQFDSKDELIQALICSTFIPFYCGTVPPMFKGVRYIDGGWSDNLPLLNDNTITVSPFSGESDICPSDTDSQSFFSFDLKNTNVRFTARNMYRVSVALFPPHPEIMSEMCREGFEDALKFLARNNLVSCTRCIAVRSSILLDNRPDVLKSGQHVHLHESSFFLPNETIAEEEQSSKNAETTTCAHPSVAPPLRKRERYVSQTKLFTPQMGVGGLTISEQTEPSDVECETCKKVATHASKKGLPKVVRDTLEHAEASERNLISYLLDCRPVKWVRYLTIPWLLPFDIAIAGCTKFLEWLPFIPEDSVWFANRATEALTFILKEIESQRSKSSRLTCQLAITDMNYSSHSQTQDLPPQAAAICIHGHVDKSGRRKSVVSVDGGQTQSAGQRTVTELNFGFSVDMQQTNNEVLRMSNIVARDTVKKSEFRATNVANIAENLGIEGLRQAAAIGGPSSPINDVSLQDNFDTYSSILQYTQQHEALMAYYYLDEHNQLKVTKIFGLDSKGSSDFPNVSSGLSGGPSRKNSTAHKRFSLCAERLPEIDNINCNKNVECPSSEPSVAKCLSVDDINVAVSSQTATPPVSTECKSMPLERSRSFSKYRRVQKPRAQSHSRKQTSLPFVPSSGTASESETEQLFRPERKRNHNQQTSEDAYEAEDSSE